MSVITRLVHGLRALVGRTRSERELEEELDAYLEMAVEQKMAAGLTREEANRAAHAELGSVEAVKDHVRDVGWEVHVQMFVQDAQFGLRSFLRTPGFTVPALLTLALGIGATAATFSLIRAVLLEPLPYPEPDRVVAVWETTRGGASRNSIAPANFVAWQERARTLEHLAMVGPRAAAVVVGGEPRQLTGLTASSALFRVLGVEPVRGRAYSVDEDGGADVIVLSHEFWERSLGGHPDVLGSALTVDGDQREVIGIMPPGFTVAGQAADFLVPYGATSAQLRAARGRGSSFALGRLKDGAAFPDAVAEMRVLYAALEREVPERNAGRSVMLFPLQEQMVGEIRPALLTLMGAALMVLAIACVNVANLLLARGAARAREVAMRAALGARPGRLVRQMLTESLVLAAAGGIAGVGVAALVHRGLLALVRERVAIPRLDQASLDPSVVAVALLLALTTGMAFGLVPAWVTVSSAASALGEGRRQAGSRRLHRALNALVVAEVALSLLLLVGAGLLLRSFVAQSRIDTGYDPAGVLAARVRLPVASFDPPRATALIRDALGRVAAMPGVSRVAASTCLPPPASCTATSVWRLDQPAPPEGARRSAQLRPVSPTFFQTLGIVHRSGRDFTDADTADSAPVAIVSEAFAREYVDTDNLLDLQLHINTVPHASGRDDLPWTVIGIVRDVRSSVDGVASPTVYVPLTQMPSRDARFFVRTHGEAPSLTASLTRLIREMAPDAPVEVRGLDEVVAATIGRSRVLTALVGAFAALALLLAAVGVYGVIAYSVRERRSEIAVRMAIGASIAAVGRLVLGHALRLVGVGVIVGLVAAAGMTRLLQRLLFNVEPLDPWTFALAPLVLLTVAALASFVPARRGMRTPPAEVLRAS